MKTNIFSINTLKKVALFSIFGLFVSCSDFDFDEARKGQTEEEKAYNDRFVEIVGEFAENHTWSTAQQSGVAATLPGSGSHVLRIYTADPRKPGAYLLGRYEVESGVALDLKFDRPASVKSVYAVVDEGSIVKQFEFDANGNLSIAFDETRAGATRAEDSVVNWGLFTFPYTADDYAHGCDDSDQPYNWENHWDNMWQHNMHVTYVENMSGVSGASGNYTGWTTCNINGSGYDYSASNLNSYNVMPTANFSPTPMYTSDGESKILCPLGQNIAGTQSFGIYYLNGTEKVRLDEIPVDWVAWGKEIGQNRTDSQAKCQSGAIYDNGNWENPKGGKTMGYEFTLPAGTQYGVYIKVNDEYLYSGDSGRDSLFAVSGDESVPEDGNKVHHFISFETNGQYRDCKDITFAFIGGVESPVEPVIPVPDEPEVETYFPWLIACEDLGSAENSDFDYNDIIFEVSINPTTNYALIRPLAAGGTLPAEIWYKNTSGEAVPVVATLSDGTTTSEVHKWLKDDANAAYQTMLNTENGTVWVGLDAAPEIEIEDLADSATMSRFSDFFFVKVHKTSGTEDINQDSEDDVQSVLTSNSVSNAPRMICIDNSGGNRWRWMKEYNCIIDGYIKFIDWAANPTDENANWYEDITEEDLVIGADVAGTARSFTITREPEVTIVSCQVVLNKTTINHGEAVVPQVVATLSNGTTMTLSEFTFSASSDCLTQYPIASFVANLPRVAQNPTYTFTKNNANGYNSSDSITGTATVSAKIGVISTVTQSYVQQQSRTVTISASKEGYGSVTSATVTVIGEAAGNPSTENVALTWSSSGLTSSVSGSDLTKNVSFSAAATGAITATQANSGNTLTWNVNVTEKTDGGTTPPPPSSNEDEVSVLSNKLIWSTTGQNQTFGSNVADLLSVGSILRIYFNANLPDWAVQQQQRGFVKVKGFNKSTYYGDKYANSDGTQTILEIAVTQAIYNDLNSDPYNKGITIEGQFVDITDITIE